ncbi:hypothetical protein ESCO_004828 [Escovopsis weberi]|uniref:Uncharacterized protein n=1 Tax=Escovopsis weberi TaxID=150374 RepID=A0A0M9VRL4_ESCWE|nr:hypothetical protein ESCO_004828 [Escovopsis weberi]
MTSKLDRLERFFTSRRRTSPAVVQSEAPATQALEQQFPSPSFIRPKTSRMTARDEVRFRQVNDRSPSVPDINYSRLGSVGSRLPALPVAHGQTDWVPSVNGPCLEPLMMELNEFQFPAPPSRNGELTPISMTFECPAPDYVNPPSPRSRSPTRARAATHTDRTLPLDALTHRALPRIKIPLNCLPTPRESFHMAFELDSPSTDSLTDSTLKSTLFDDFQDQLDDAFGQFYPNSSGRTSKVMSRASCRLTVCSTTLREPDFNDFLNLSDDDIAELTPDTPDSTDGAHTPYTPDTPSTPTGLEFLSRKGSKPSLPTMSLSISPSQPCNPTLLTLTPPRASRPAESGALMAARIARRFDFDLIYVVNLWPGNRSCQVLDSEVSARPLVGRLLAAHGLQHVPSPLQISSDVHTSILGTDGWTEYRDKTARPDELSHGYARGFYTGKCARNSSEHTPRHVGAGPQIPGKGTDRGIVFAAYRKPRRGDPNLSQGLTEDQLACLHDEAETLINVLLDIHAQNRIRQPESGRRLSDETGPMPFF